jgi:hypothetical protein
MLPMGNPMERQHPLSWPVAVSLLALTLVILGDTCAPQSPGPESKEAEERASRSPETGASQASPAARTESVEARSAPAALADVNPAAGSYETSTPEPAPAPPPAAETAPTFETTVRPILATRCAPCHNPGGRMYERLPFDNSDVVAEHASGVQRRLKDEDRKAFERWLETLPKGGETAR